MSLQSAFTGIPGKGLDPSLHGVLATKTPKTEEVPGLFCEQAFMAKKNNREDVKRSLSCRIDLIFMKDTSGWPGGLRNYI